MIISQMKFTEAFETLQHSDLAQLFGKKIISMISSNFYGVPFYRIEMELAHINLENNRSIVLYLFLFHYFFYYRIVVEMW